MPTKSPEPTRKCPVCRQPLSGNYCIGCGFHDDGAVMSKRLEVDAKLERRSKILRIKQFLYRLFGIGTRF